MNEEIAPNGDSGSEDAAGIATAEQVAAAKAEVEEIGRRRSKIKLPETTGLLAVLLIEFVFFSITSEFFLRTDNLINVLQNVAVIGIIACPATLLLVAGQVDLSVGSAAGFIGMSMAVAATATDAATTPYGLGLTLVGAFLVTLLVTLLIGGINGSLVTVVGLNSIITTLGTLAILRGLTKVIGDGQTIRINGFNKLGVVRPLFNIPLSVYLFVAMVIIFYVIMRFTVYGRAMYAIGASPEAARLAGIRVRLLIFIGFMLSALAVALGGLIRLSQKIGRAHV